MQRDDQILKTIWKRICKVFNNTPNLYSISFITKEPQEDHTCLEEALYQFSHNVQKDLIQKHKEEINCIYEEGITIDLIDDKNIRDRFNTLYNYIDENSLLFSERYCLFFQDDECVVFYREVETNEIYIKNKYLKEKIRW